MDSIEITSKPQIGEYKRNLASQQFNLLQNIQSATYGASLMTNILGSAINYNLLKTQNANLGVQANQIELQAEEEINQLQKSFNGAVGDIQYNAAARGIKTNSGSIQNNIELSAKNLSEDMYIIRKNAKNQATSLRSQQNINNKLANAQLWSGVGGSLMNFGGQMASMGMQRSAFDKINK